MKRAAAILLLFILVLSLTGCGRLTLIPRLSQMTGVDLAGTRVEAYHDTHGGFLGDGYLTAIVRIGNEKTAEDIAAAWKRCPVPDELKATLDAWTAPWSVGKYPQDSRAFELPDGYYFYYDRFRETEEVPPADSVPQNFTLLVFDPQSGRLYVYELDT